MQSRFNTGSNIAEAVNFGDEDTLRNVSGWIACTKRTCGSSSPAVSNLSMLPPGQIQELTGLTNPQNVETFVQGRETRK